MVVGKIKTLILGAGGMLGKELSKVFPNAIKFTRSEIDITDEDRVLSMIENINPDVVVNAAAYTNVDGCEETIKSLHSMLTAELLSILQGAVPVKEQPLYIIVPITFSTA